MIEPWQRCRFCGNYVRYVPDEYLYHCTNCSEWYCFEELQRYEAERREAGRA